MKITTSIEQLAEPIGFDIGNSTDEVQGNLINGLSRAFRSMNDYDYDMQLSYLSQYLTPEAKRFISKLNEFVK